MSRKIYQIQISLKDFQPKIWRRAFIPSDLLLSDVHKIIQTCMGWTNSHLHQFIKNDVIFTHKSPELDYDDTIQVDYKNIKLSDLLKKEKERIIYEYDFGDGWEHDIILEKILAFDKDTRYPVCLDGEMNCPPEDCGGAFGYSDLLDILKNPDHEEYESYIEWLGGEFDPEYFDKKKVNELLQEEDYGCIEF